MTKIRKEETHKIYEFVSEIDTVFAAYYSHEKFGAYMLKNYEQN